MKNKNKKIILVSSILAFSSGAYATVPSAGSVIGNQATANYTDGSGQNKTATSNLVETTVAKIAGVSIISDQSKTVSVGGTILFQHTIENTGNGIDSFDLSAVDLNSGNINFADITIYPDADKNGVPDSTNEITKTPNISSGGSYGILVSATTPNSSTNGDLETIRISATSSFDGAVVDSNVDTVNVTGNAVIDVTKSLSVSSGPSPSIEPINVTLTYTNTGDSAASTIVFTDTLPTGMTYVPNSANWSGIGQTLTDSSDGDEGGVDYQVSGNTITANIGTIASGSSGTITFKVTIDAGVPPSSVSNIANVSYNDGSGSTVGPISTNASSYTVQQTSLVNVDDSASVYDEDGVSNDVISINTPVSQGSTVVFDSTVTNNGNGNDTFEIKVSENNNTFPVGTVFQFFKADGATPLSDTNSDGTPDTGIVAAGTSIQVIVKAILPSTFYGDQGYSFSTEAISKFDTSVVDIVMNTLSEVLQSTVDVTADLSISEGANSTNGLGQGAEVSPVKSESINPSEVVNFVLFANNTSTIPDNYKLEVSTDPTFTTNILPSDWSVSFKNSGSNITSTGSIPANGNKRIDVEVSIPFDEEPKTESLYFRIISQVTGAFDIIHNEVVVETVNDLSITPNNTGQIFPSGTTIYTHSINNSGNVVETEGVIAATNSVSGWNAIVYLDVNNDGLLDGGDISIDNINDISGGINPKSSVNILVKVFSPSGANEGNVNNTTITISGVLGETNTSNNSANNVSTVIEGDVTLSKKQGLDNNCDGLVDGSMTTAQISNVMPGSCVVYEIVATNTGSAPITSLEINDTTPSFTKYFDCTGACSATSTVGVVSTPSNLSSGVVTVDVGNLNPSNTVILEFVVKIDE